MRLKDLNELLNRAAAALETPGDLSEDEKRHVIEDLTVAAQDKPKARTAESANTAAAVWSNTWLGVPSGFIQWKGTEVCMDVYCKCGYHSHIDASFTYYIECPNCNTVFAANPRIELIELKQRPAPNEGRIVRDGDPADPDSFDEPLSNWVDPNVKCLHCGSDTNNVKAHAKVCLIGEAEQAQLKRDEKP